MLDNCLRMHQICPHSGWRGRGEEQRLWEGWPKEEVLTSGLMWRQVSKRVWYQGKCWRQLKGRHRLEGFGEGWGVRAPLEHWGGKPSKMALTSEHHLRPTYISARYVQGNAASSGREEKRGSKTYKCLPPSSAHFLLPTFSPSTSSPSSEVSNELCPTSIRAQIASWKIVRPLSPYQDAGSLSTKSVSWYCRWIQCRDHMGQFLQDGKNVRFMSLFFWKVEGWCGQTKRYWWLLSICGDLSWLRHAFKVNFDHSIRIKTLFTAPSTWPFCQILLHL